MSVSERALMEADLADIIGGEFSVPTVITDPLGVSYPVDAMVVYDARRETVGADGYPVIVKEMVVTYPRAKLPTSILEVIANPEPPAFKIAIPQHPTSATFTTYLIDLSKVPEIGYTLGTIRFYPKMAVQG